MIDFISSTCLVGCIILLFPLAAPAMPAISCHCFTERSYDPVRPAAADPYFLATTQNSFFAALFNVDKKSVVMKKQLGSHADDLWVAYWVASKAGVSAESLLQSKQGGKGWRELLLPLRLSPHRVGSRFCSALNSALSTAKLAEAVLDEVFLRYKLLPESELTAVRQEGMSNQEVLLATIIAARSRQSVGQIWREARGGSKTWGAQLQAAGIEPKELQREVDNLLKLAPR
ncbi:MAG TPA: hypothetical protein HPP94_03625 [Desulfuromonadales bacterium]|nr:hypothetical protein [Desulfuromonadales bacterium]